MADVLTPFSTSVMKKLSRTGDLLSVAVRKLDRAEHLSLNEILGLGAENMQFKVPVAGVKFSYVRGYLPCSYTALRSYLPCSWLVWVNERSSWQMIQRYRVTLVLSAFH